jgi:xanthine dehydrogenase accessory factor
MAHALADLAQVIGWHASVVDWPDFSAAAGERAVVIVATQGHGDEDAVERAVASRPNYLGLVASAKRGAAILGYLAERGIPQDQLDRVRVPAGLDLGRTSHVEIAVAVLAELVRLRAAGELTPAAPSGPSPAREVTATDPVCGMTVAATPASLSSEHDSVTYYFCATGCRTAFESDPASYPRNESRC